MNEYKAPTKYPVYANETKIFLAGSIELDTAEQWQTELTKKLSDLDNVTIFNPRRDNWNNSWKQSIDNPHFREQVEWELKAQEDADLIIMYFDPSTKSAITLLELGLFKDKPIVVCCPEGFWKKGNVDIVCKWYDIPLTDNKELFFDKIHNFIQSL